MSWSFPIGHLFGSELRVHVTFFLLLGWIGIVGFLDTGPQGAVVHLLYILLLFACVIAHEFGHALTARRYGIRTPDVTLLPIGGVARLEKMPDKPGQEILVALAGPAVNVVIFLILVALLGPTAVEQAIQKPITLANLPAQIAALNLILALFNLIPAFPMDGGRVLRAILSTVMDRVAATKAAATAGQVLAFAMGLLGLVSGNPILMFIAFCIFMSAGAESNDAVMRQLAHGLRARDAMVTEFEALAPGDSLDLAAATLIRTTQHEFPVLDPESGVLIGLLTRRALYAALDHEPRPLHVGDVTDRHVPSVGLTEKLTHVLALMEAGARAVMVTSPDGRVIGFVNRENVGELMVLANARQKRADRAV
ncbi:MAG: site-2 protease family protein [Maritimibacter sp.]